MEERDEIRVPDAEDTAVEAAVLRQLLALHPVPLTLRDLQREIAGEPGDFAARDAVERAVRDLTAAGLVHRSGDVVLPSRAALRFDELLG
ncbi:MAG TPA: hypothetical protein VLK56_04580 [Solirubrobacterales bacterium]|nr:hypothetical protein [Solirubrobacterales bacterium]